MARRGTSKRVGQQLDQGGIGGAVDRRRVHLDLERIAVPADDPRARGTRLQVNLQPQGRPARRSRAHRSDRARSRRLATRKPCRK